MINKQSVLQRLAMQLGSLSAQGVGRVSLSLTSEIRKLPNEEICLTNDVISGKATSLICKGGPGDLSITSSGMQRRSCLCWLLGKEARAWRQQWGLPAWPPPLNPSCMHPHTSAGFSRDHLPQGDITCCHLHCMSGDPGSPSTAAQGL